MEMVASAFENAVQARAARARQPLRCLFEITPTCNLRCHFCYVALDPYKGPYLTTEQACRVLDVIAGSGVLWLTLTGGEIFSRRDFREIYLHARSRGLLVNLFTNATLVTEDLAAFLAEHKPAGIEISIYGADAAHYEATTGIPGSYPRFERGVQRLLDAGLRDLMLLKHTTSALTEDHVPAVRAWCEARGLRHRFSVDIEARHDGGQEPTLYRLTPRRSVALKNAIDAEAGRKPRGPLAECSEGLPAEETAGRLYQCTAGRTMYFVDALGQASHCVLDRSPAVSLLETGWADAWARIGEWVDQPLPADAPCSGCSLRGSCNNCPARSRLATGSPYLKDTYHCDATHAAHGLPPAVHAPALAALRPLAACAR